MVYKLTPKRSNDVKNLIEAETKKPQLYISRLFYI